MRLCLVGPWPDGAYRREIEQRIAACGLADAANITGPVDDHALIDHYRWARVFCLLSRCESFGIPAIEAQALGTPTVVADACAPPEVAGPGGAVLPLGDLEGVARTLSSWTSDQAAWEKASARAQEKPERFRWENLSESLIDRLLRFAERL